MNPIAVDQDLDEFLLLRNPNGGRPQKLGSYIVNRENNTYDVQGFSEETCIRYHLGYCTCGRKLMIGPKRAGYLMSAMKKHGLGEIPKFSFRVWIARTLLKVSVDKS